MLTSAVSFLATAANIAAGRAWMPCSSNTNTGRSADPAALFEPAAPYEPAAACAPGATWEPTAACGPARGCEPGAPCATVAAALSGDVPMGTSPVPAFAVATTSIRKSPTCSEQFSLRRETQNPVVSVTSTGVTRLFACCANSSRSKVISRSPAATLWPCRTCNSKPCPANPTVSIPTCSRISAPLSARSVTACLVVATTINVPSQGACNVVPVGSMATPSPIMPPEKTGSGVSPSGVPHPCSGESRMTLDALKFTPTGPSR
jgi:hypothetical protein